MRSCVTPLSTIKRGCVAACTAVALLAGCATEPQVPLGKVEPLACPPAEKPVCPAPATKEPVPPPAAIEDRGKLDAAQWVDLPDWGRESLRPRWKHS